MGNPQNYEDWDEGDIPPGEAPAENGGGGK